jgi:uncharacterized protein (TIGR02328 family)
MRIWHIDLLPYLPDAQFKGQLRELVAIMHDWRDKGKTNHILINEVMEYPKSDLSTYFHHYMWIYYERYGKEISNKIIREFEKFAPYYFEITEPIYEDWHCTDYLRVCMANLYEKHEFAKGKSRITDEEWQKLLDGYREITGTEYKI